MNRPNPCVALVPMLLAAACSRPKDVVPTAHAASETIVVSTAQAVVRTVPAAFEVTGTFNADEISNIAPPVGGRVIATPVNVGDFVKQGAAICELDHRDAQLKLDQAHAQLDEATSALRQTQARIGWTAAAKFDPILVPEVAAARAAYESALAQSKMAAADARRYESLVGSGDVSRGAYERARTQQETAEAQANAARQQYEAALNAARQGYGAIESSAATLEAVRSQLAQAQKGLEDTTVRAPFDGYITARAVAAGEYVSPSSKIATIVRIGILKLQLQAPEQRAANVHTGMTVTARVSAYPDREFSGTVTAVNPSVDPSSRVFMVEARFDNPGAKLRPGMFASARVLLPGGETAVFIPRRAVIRDKTTDSYQVFTIDRGAARLHVVLAGDVDGDSIRIASGLSGGETVAISSQSELFDGARVRIGP